MKLTECCICKHNTPIRFKVATTGEPVCPSCAHTLAEDNPCIVVREEFSNHPVKAGYRTISFLGLPVYQRRMLIIKNSDTEVVI